MTIRDRDDVWIGMSVDVHAYGRRRPGIVTHVGRTRATVLFVRNKAGDQAERLYRIGPREYTYSRVRDGVSAPVTEQHWEMVFVGDPFHVELEVIP